MEDIIEITGWILLALMLGVFVGGLTRHVVVYYDNKDLNISFGVSFLMLVAILTFFSADMDGRAGTTEYYLYLMGAGVCAFASLILLIISFYNAVHYNRSILIGLVVGIFKIPFAWITIVFIFDSFCSIFLKGRKAGERLTSAFLAIFFAAILTALVNGPEVHEKKGWEQ